MTDLAVIAHVEVQAISRSEIGAGYGLTYPCLIATVSRQMDTERPSEDITKKARAVQAVSVCCLPRHRERPGR